MEEGTEAHSSLPARRIPWTEEPGGLRSIGSQTVTQLKRLSMHARMQGFHIHLRRVSPWPPAEVGEEEAPTGGESHSGIGHLSPESPGGLELGD